MMTHKTKFFGVLVSLAIAQVASAQQVSKPLASLTGGSLTGKILCHDGSKVPMTADPEQALPLNIVGLLSCGQEVSLLSGNEGYTINVHSADGRSGYVAWMNAAKNDTSSTKKIVRQTAPVHDGVPNWVVSTPGSERLYSDDLLVESLTANGVTVQVSLQDTGWKLLAHVAVANEGSDSVNIAPSRLALSEVGQANKSLVYQDASKLRSAYTHQILWARATAAPSEKAYSPNSSQSYSRASAATTQNYLAQHQATVQLVKADFNPHAKTQSVALTQAVLLPDQQIAGSSWFQGDNKRKEMVLHVPVGGIVYEFPFSFQSH